MLPEHESVRVGAIDAAISHSTWRVRLSLSTFLLPGAVSRIRTWAARLVRALWKHGAEGVVLGVVGHHFGDAPMPAWAKAAAAHGGKPHRSPRLVTRPLSRRSGNGRRPSNGRSRNRIRRLDPGVSLDHWPPAASGWIRPASSRDVDELAGRLSLIAQRALPLARITSPSSGRTPKASARRAAQHSSHGAFGHPLRRASWLGPQRCFRRRPGLCAHGGRRCAEANDESARTVLESAKPPRRSAAPSDGRIA